MGIRRGQLVGLTVGRARRHASYTQKPAATRKNELVVLRRVRSCGGHAVDKLTDATHEADKRVPLVTDTLIVHAVHKYVNIQPQRYTQMFARPSPS